MKIGATDGSEIQALVALGADVHAKGGRNASTALHRAATVQTAQALLDCGAIVDDGNFCSWTPLMYVCNGNSSADRAGVVTTLLESGAQVNALNNRGMTALHMAGGKFQGSGSPPESEAVMLVSLLLAAGANTTLKNNNGQTALELARAGNRSEVAKALQQAVPRRIFFNPVIELQSLRNENTRLRQLVDAANRRIEQVTGVENQDVAKLGSESGPGSSDTSI